MDGNSTYWQFVAYWDALLEPMTSPQERQELYIPLWNDLSDYWRNHGPPSLDPIRDVSCKRPHEAEELMICAVKKHRGR
jgi:hypothetical protein